MALRRVCELKIWNGNSGEENLLGSYLPNIEVRIRPTGNPKPSHEMVLKQGHAGEIRVTGMFAEKANDGNIIMSGNVKPNCFFRVISESGKFWLAEDFPMSSVTKAATGTVNSGFFSSIKASIAGRELGKVRLQKAKKK